MRRAGLIVNPQSGKDIRRIVGGGTTASYQDKVDLIRRIITGLVHGGVDEILMMSDPTGMARRACNGLDGVFAEAARVLAMWSDGTAEDTDRAVDAMVDQACGCIITVGGDGTHRRVSRRCGEIPLLPLPGGTNNVFSEPLDGLVAGLAAGAFLSSGRARRTFCWRNKRLVVERDGEPVDEALIDVAVSDHLEVGARALWEPERLTALVLSQGLPTRIGLSAIGGMLEPIGPREKAGLHVQFKARRKEGRSIRAGILPGVLAEVNVKKFTKLNIDEAVFIPAGTGTLAMDGEREIVMRKGRHWAVRLQKDGPWRLDVDRTMREAVKRNWLNRADG